MGQGSQVLGGQAGVNRESRDGCRELYGTSKPNLAPGRHTRPKKHRVEFVAHPRTVPAAPPRFRRERNMKATQRCGLVTGLLVVQIIEDSDCSWFPMLAVLLMRSATSRLGA